VTDFRLAEEPNLLIRSADDASLPPRFLPGDGAREVIWGVDNEESLRAVESELGRDREITRDGFGALRSVDPNGIRIGFRVFERVPLDPVGTVENTLTSRARWNSPRRWYDRADPKLIQHIVFGVPEVDAALDFYVGRLNFRISDMSRGRGVFLRSQGRNEHHNLFFLKNMLSFNHLAFGVDSIDELMAGANHMQRQGWKTGVGFGRHRISSIVYFYMKCPGGGEIEYAADGDYLDDDWRPRLWNPAYGNQHWVGEAKEGSSKPPPDVEPLPNPLPRFG
jgi:catechol 2,3-dioxygenase-like lactoylglutathione lyase family enzyme